LAIPLTDWKQAIVPPKEQSRIRHSRLSGKVMRSMAFEGEPVDQRMVSDAKRLPWTAGGCAITLSRWPDIRSIRGSAPCGRRVDRSKVYM
jgi:hypothetical protein